MREWDGWLTLQEQELGKEAVEKWLRPLKVLKFDAQNLYLEAPTPFFESWFEEHHRNTIKEHFKNGNDRSITVHLSVSGKHKKDQKKPSPSKNSPKQPEFSIQFLALDSIANFENFLVTEENALVLKLLAPLSTSCECNPIYIHGPEGSGKTHLLMAVAHELKERGLHPLYVSAKTFTEHVIKAIRASEMIQFRNIYRKSDVLLIDDVHLFSRKYSTQEELFHTFNTLHLARKPIVLASPTPPAELIDIEARLISRFEWGIVLQLHKLDKEALKRLVAERAQLLGYDLPTKVVQFLVRTFARSPHTLLGALKALILRCHLKKPTKRNFCTNC